MEFRLELSLNKKKGFNFGAMGSSGMLRAVLLLFPPRMVEFLVKLKDEGEGEYGYFSLGGRVPEPHDKAH